MPELKIIEQKPINVSELKEVIKDIKKREEELGFRTTKVAEYVDIQKTLKDHEEIFKKIEKLGVPRLKDIHIHKIIDLIPANMIELKNIVQGYALTITNDNLEKILEVVNEYAPKKK